MSAQVKIGTVIVLNDYCHVQGGASRVAVDEAVALAQQGLEVIFFGAVGPVCDELKQAPLTVICLDQPELLNVGKNPGVMLQGLVQTYIIFDGSLSSWWTKIVIGVLLFLFIVLQRIIFAASAPGEESPEKV